jgi:hypothetical protein
MFLITTGIRMGANVSTSKFIINNLIPVTVRAPCMAGHVGTTLLNGRNGRL